MQRPGKLTLISGPIGNLGDLSPRAEQAIKEADFVIAEDSRITGRLLAHLEEKKPMRRLNDQARPDQIKALSEEIHTQGNWILLTDAGTPGISDPGAQLVDILLDQGAEVDCVPGPSAVTTAIALSGFFAQRFAFLGFLPRKPGPVSEILAPFAESTLTLVIFESPNRFLKTLEECAKTLGNRRFAIAREMTKLHQQLYRGTLPDLPSQQQVPAKGEFTLVIEGYRRKLTETDRL